MSIGIHYITSKQCALKSIGCLTNTDLYILDILFNISHPVSNGVLFRMITTNVTTISNRLYCDALKKCVGAGYITRIKYQHTVSLTITLEGKLLIKRFDEVLERSVRNKILQYGNGLE